METYRDRPNEPPLPEPLAYFLTWATYGTWLPGDERGWVKYGEGLQLPDPIRKLEAEALMIEGACRLDEQQRDIVEKTIADHCTIRAWHLFATNCRSNHLHVIVNANRDPDEVRKQFKAWCTRKLKELERERTALAPPGPEEIRTQWWAERGSKRFLNDEESLEAAIRYVRDGQDPPH
jgi:REP element-mobilizing transposase RayT